MSPAEADFLRALRRVFEQGNQAWNEGDLERAYQVLGDDFEYELASTWPETRPLRGRDDVVGFFQAFRETFPDVRAGPLDFVEISERRLVVGFPVVGTGRSSGARVEIEVWQVWELAETGTPVRVKEYPDRGAALRAAGLAD